MNKRRWWAVALGATVLVALVALCVHAAFTGPWRPDLANTAWGTIISAVVTGVVGVLLRGAIEQELDRRKSDLSLYVQREVERERGEVMKSLEERKANLTREVQAELEAVRAAHLREIEEQKAALTAGVQSRIEALRAELARVNAEDAARRDYEYDARKRLYQECEPLIFQLREQAENALSRVLSLARSSRDGNLQEDGAGWLAGVGYYTESTAYALLAPAAMFKIIQARLTAVDLRLDPRVEAIYQLAKRYLLAFTDDFTLARTEPRLPYDPNRDGWEERRKVAPREFWMQGVYWGRLDNAVEELIERDGGGGPRCKSFGRFQREWRHDAEFKKVMAPVAEVLRGFHPLTRPVLWRVLVVQAHIASAILAAAGADAQVPMPLPAIDPSLLDWRGASGSADDAAGDPARVAATYLRQHLPKVWTDPG